MDTIDFTRTAALNNVPKKKLKEIIANIETTTENISDRTVKLIAVNRYAESNIPIEYWTLNMEQHFHGDPRLLNKYNEYVSDLKVSYTNGSSICLAGSHGTGKTLTSTCILKKACHKGFSTLYSTLSDIVNVLTAASNEEKYLARRELTMVDFLVIDELDPRFMPSDNASDLYARSLESIFRTRSQNKLPTLMCTNSPNVIESFHGAMKASLSSLMKGYIKMFPVLGEDERKKKS